MFFNLEAYFWMLKNNFENEDWLWNSKTFLGARSYSDSKYSFLKLKQQLSNQKKFLMCAKLIIYYQKFQVFHFLFWSFYNWWEIFNIIKIFFGNQKKRLNSKIFILKIKEVKINIYCKNIVFQDFAFTNF